MKKMVAAFCGLVSLLPGLAHSSSSITAHVTSFGTYGNGNVYIALDKPIDQSGCAIANIELPANGPANKTVLMTAATALATGSSINVVTDICYNNTPSFSGTRSTYFVILKS